MRNVPSDVSNVCVHNVWQQAGSNGSEWTRCHKLKSERQYNTTNTHKQTHTHTITRLRWVGVFPGENSQLLPQNTEWRLFVSHQSCPTSGQKTEISFSPHLISPTLSGFHNMQIVAFQKPAVAVCPRYRLICSHCDNHQQKHTRTRTHTHRVEPRAHGCTHSHGEWQSW